MAYLGKDLVGIMSYSRAKDTMTGDGSTTTLTLSRDPGTQNNVEIYMDGVLQTPGVEYTLSGKVVTFTTAPETGLNVVALSGTETEIMEPADNSVVASHLVNGLTLTDAKITGLSSSKLSGALPALDGSTLTNMPAGITVKSASDPAIDTNHANGVGTTWVNTTSGEMYVCIDATTDANIWFNVGGGSGDVQPYVYQGTSYGYALGGYNIPANYKDYIQKFSFASSSTSTTPGSLLNTRYDGAGGVSSTHGWMIGGTGGEGNHPSAPCTSIEKFAFASDSGNVTVGDLQAAPVPGPGMGSESSSSGDYIYAAWSVEANYSSNNWIERISTTTDGDASGDIGNLNIPRISHAQMSSDSYAYISGGTDGSLTANIERFAFAANVTSASVGTLTVARGNAVGVSSTTDGYNTGGPYGNWTIIDKISFASGSENGVDHGDLVNFSSGKAGSSGTTHAYVSGGNYPTNSGTTGRTSIDEFAYASNVTATNAGDLDNGVYGPGGTHV